MLQASANSAQRPPTATGNTNSRSCPLRRYLIQASKSGYVQMGYKQTRPNTGSRRSRSASVRAETASTSPCRRAASSPAVVDESGEPVSEVLVRAQRLQFVNGARRPVPAGAPSSSNDIGEFRITALPRPITTSSPHHALRAVRSIRAPIAWATVRRITRRPQTLHPPSA